MKVRVKYDAPLSLTVGLDKVGYHVINFNPQDLSQEQRAFLAKLHYDSSNTPPSADFYLDRARDMNDNNVDAQLSLPLYVSEPTVKELGLAIDNIVAALKEEQGKRNQAARENAEREKKQQEEREARTATAIGQFMANPHLLPTGRYNGGFYIDRDRHALIFPQNTEVFAECERRVAAEKEREEKEEQLKRERKEQRQKEKWDFLRNFITKHGDKSEQERLAENLLSEEEAVSIVRDHTFAPLDRFDRYEKTDAIHGDECYRSGECDESWDVEPAASVNRGVWDSTSEIRRTAKEMGAEWAFQTHTCITSECEEETRKFGLLVSQKVGPFTLSREYECRE